MRSILTWSAKIPQSGNGSKQSESFKASVNLSKDSSLTVFHTHRHFWEMIFRPILKKGSQKFDIRTSEIFNLKVNNSANQTLVTRERLWISVKACRCTRKFSKSNGLSKSPVLLEVQRTSKHIHQSKRAFEFWLESDRLALEANLPTYQNLIKNILRHSIY